MWRSLLEDSSAHPLNSAVTIDGVFEGYDPQLSAPGNLRASPGLPAKVMSERLRKLTLFGIVDRQVFSGKPPIALECVVTPFGRRFLRILDDARTLHEAIDAGEVGAPG